MLDVFRTFDENLFLFLNAQHNTFLDPLMWLFSNKLFWGPFYVWVLWLLYKRYPNQYWTVLVAILVMIFASDQICNLFKENIMRLRPTHEPHLEGLIHTLNGYKGGTYGFYSAHASNSFALAFFALSATMWKNKFLVLATLLYASLTAYSRIYLGVHYPGDILAGALMGAIIGTGVAYVHNKLRSRYLPEQT